MIYTTIDEILALFPHVSGESDGELHTPCPFCKKGTAHRKNGITFRGDDRLIWYVDRKGVSCRQCGTYASMAKLLELLQPGAELSASFDTETQVVTAPKKPLWECLTAERYVRKLHTAVDRNYWKRNLWTDTTINRFLLGYGQLYEYGSYRLPRHVIPFQPRDTERVLDGYMLEGRLSARSDATEHEKYNIKTQGSTKGYFWYIHDSTSDEIAIAEGPKDAITAWQLGYKNVLAIFGTSGWKASFAHWLADQGYVKATLFGDNDDAGKKFVENAVRDLHGAAITPYCLTWPDGLPQGYDLTDALMREGESGIALWLSRHLHHAKGSRGWIADITTYIPEYAPPNPEEATPLETIREALPKTINSYVKDYKMRVKSAGKGVVKVLAAPPGAGKSYALVQLAQQEAKRLLERKATFLNDYASTKAALLAEAEETDDPEELLGLQEQLKTLETRHENYTIAKVLFASPFVNAWEDVQTQPGFDESLWFNFESRNPDTCQNHITANQIGAKGYSVMKYCETVCPFARDCASRVGGYLMQKRLMRLRPITFVRHANLISKDLLDEYEVIIIDENFLNVFSDFATIENLLPVDDSWRDFLTYEEEEGADALERLAGAVRALSSVKEEVSGRDCLLALENALGEPLVPLVRSIPQSVVDRFQPKAIPASAKVEALPPCQMPKFFRALLDELDDFESGQYYNSRMHIAKGADDVYRLKVSTLFPLELARNKKVIVADGTAMPELYGLLFDRAVEVYQPDLYNDKAKIVQLTGTDLSRSTIQRQIGSWAYSRLGKAAEEEEEAVITDVMGEPIDLDDVPYTEDMYASTALNGIMTMIRSVGLKPEHRRILFVTYKNLRHAIEHRLTKLAETDEDYEIILKKMAFGHYGGLRGTNRYQHYDTVLLAGCPRQPYNELHRVIQAWARLKGYAKYIPNQLAFRPAPYHGKGIYSGYTYVTFEDEFAQMFVEMVEAGEVRQCLDRIRIYSSETPKTAYLYMARPSARWITDITSSRMAVARAHDARYAGVEQFVREVYEEFQTFPKFAVVADRFSLSRRKAKEFVEAAKKALLSVSE